MTNPKFELTGKTYIHFGITLRQIRALRDFGDVKKGSLGGFIQKEANLSQDGNCWVYDQGLVYQNALVADDAAVKGGAWVYNSARLLDNSVARDKSYVLDHATCCDNSVVEGEAFVSGSATLKDSCKVSEYAGVWGNAVCEKHCKVSGRSMCYGTALITANAKVRGSSRIFEGVFDTGCYENYDHCLVNAALHG